MRSLQFIALGLLSIIISQLTGQISYVTAQSLSKDCVSYDSSTQALELKCGSATLSSINQILDNSQVLQVESDRVWLLNADLIIGKGATLDLTSEDIDWLKLANPHGIINYGNLVIDSIKVTSWDIQNNNYATTDGTLPRSFIVTWEGGSGKMDISNSELSYLGYKESHKQGLGYYSGDHSVLKNNNIHHMWYGFYSNAVGFLTIENNEIHDNVVYGIDPHTGTHDMIIRGNIVYNITDGIGIICSFECYNILMEDNVVYDVSTVGLMLSRESVNSVIRNNFVHNSGQIGGGVSVDASSNNQVYNNTIVEGRFGIKVSNNSHKNTVYNNTVSNSFDYGICILDNSTSNAIHKNDVRNIAQYGICAMRGSSDNEVRQNSVSNSGFYGIYVRDPDATQNLFSNNSIIGTRQDGVRVFNNTRSIFESNTVIDSTKYEYSLASAEIQLLNTSFDSTHFEGIAGPSGSSSVHILNSADNRLIISDIKSDNMISNNNALSLNFSLNNGKTAVLSTIPFKVNVVSNLTAATTISFLDGAIEGNAAKMTWVARNQGPTDISVTHRIENFNPGVHLKVVESNTKTVAEKTVGSDGVFEFTLTEKPGDTHYAIISQGELLNNDSSSLPLPASVKTFGCELYGERIHCDPTLNHFGSNSVDGNFKLVAPLSSNSVFVNGKYGQAVKMDAKYRESVEISNSQSIGTKQFSFSFFIRNSDVAEPYGHVVSHVNFSHRAGWYVDMVSDKKVPPFTQTLTFSIANTKGTLFTPPAVSIPQDRFVQISGTFDGSFVKLYVDGKLSGQVRFEGEFDPNPGTPMRIGSASYSTSTNRWSGIIDEFMIYNGTLTDDQIRELPSTLSEGKSTILSSDGNILGYWPFEGDVHDASNQDRDGTTTTLLASMAFAPDGTLFFSEKNTGEIKIMRNDVILDEPFATLPDVYVNWEQGLLGLTLDSNFNNNHYVYQYYTYKAPSGQIFNKIVRFTDVNDKGVDMKVLLDEIPAIEGYHSGGALAFGPDDKLYATVGDATYHEFALDPNILIGKVLRINRDGTIPNDNPDPTSPIFTKGHRNMYGIAFDSNGTGIITENGDVLYDEVNILHKGGNYGFPLLQPANKSPYLADPSNSILPIRTYYVTNAPTQAIYYAGDKIPELKGKFLFGTFTGDIYALTVDKDTKMMIGEEKILLHPTLFTPVIGLAQAPNGDIYYGSYAIFKLESLDLATETQDYFPIDIAASKGVVVNDLSFDQDNRKFVIDIDTTSSDSSQNSQNTSGGSQSISTPYVTLTIPSTLLDEVRTVTDDSNSPLLFKVSSGGQASYSGGYYNVTISLNNAIGKNHISISAVRVVPEISLTQGFLTVSIAILILVIITIVAKYPNRFFQGDHSKFFFG